MFRRPQLSLTDFQNKKLDTFEVKEVPLPQLIQDIEKGNYYSFSIKPEDEDLQTYYAPSRKNGHWSMIAYCCLQKGPTNQLLRRLKSKSSNIMAKKE